MLAIARLGGVGAIVKIEPTHRVIFDCRTVNQKADEAVSGTADVIAPTVKISRPRMALAEVELRPKAQIEPILTIA
jgi:hypothetical protein